MFNVNEVRKDFPILGSQINEHPLVYFDNAATTQKPQVVIDALTNFYTYYNANVHRGVHTLSERATVLYENARSNIQHFINAKSRNEIVFLRSTTEAVNLVANCFLEPLLERGDEILVTEMEHHSNLVPWQMLAQRKEAILRVVPLMEDGTLNMSEFEGMLSSKVKFMAIGHISNALGTINPIKEMIAKAHAHDIPVLVDGAQATPHMAVDVQELDCDFYAFSGHKMYGPTGVGVLYSQEGYYEYMQPYQAGGDMVTTVSLSHAEFQEPPHRYEAGTPSIAGAIALSKAIEYIHGIGYDNIQAYEAKLLQYATEQLRQVPGLHIIGDSANKASIVSLKLDEVHAHDVGTLLNSKGIAVRAGHHCAMPVMDYYKVPATARISMAFYNTIEEIDLCVNLLKEVKKVFG